MPTPDAPARRSSRRRTSRDITLDARDALLAAMAEALAAQDDTDVRAAMRLEAARIAERWQYIAFPGLLNEAA